MIAGLRPPDVKISVEVIARVIRGDGSKFNSAAVVVV